MARASSWCGIAVLILSCGGTGAPPRPPPPEPRPAVAAQLAGATGALGEGDTAEPQAPAPASEVTEAPPAAAVGEVAAQPAPVEPGCEVRGIAALGPIRVEVQGERPMELTVTSRDASARLLPRARRSPVRALAPLAFEGTVATPLPLVFLRDSDLATGLVHVSRGTRIERVALANDGGLAADVELAPGVRVVGLPVTCALLGLGAMPVAEPLDSDETEGLLSRGGRLPLFAAPDAESPIAVRLSRPQQVLLTETARRDGWVRVWHSFPSGAGIAGWARESSVRAGRATPASPPPARPPVAERSPRECPTGQAGFYRGPATISGGTPVLGAPNGVEWARVAASVEAVVRTVADRDWVVIDSIPGLSGPGPCPEILDHAWVPRTAVTFPAHLTVPGSVPESPPLP